MCQLFRSVWSPTYCNEKPFFFFAENFHRRSQFKWKSREQPKPGKGQGRDNSIWVFRQTCQVFRFWHIHQQPSIIQFNRARLGMNRIGTVAKKWNCCGFKNENIFRISSINYKSTNLLKNEKIDLSWTFTLYSINVHLKNRHPPSCTEKSLGQIISFNIRSVFTPIFTPW